MQFHKATQQNPQQLLSLLRETEHHQAIITTALMSTIEHNYYTMKAITRVPPPHTPTKTVILEPVQGRRDGERGGIEEYLLIIVYIIEQ